VQKLALAILAVLTIAKLCNLLRCRSKGEGWRRRIRKDGVEGMDSGLVGVKGVVWKEGIIGKGNTPQ